MKSIRSRRIIIFLVKATHVLMMGRYIEIKHRHVKMLAIS